MTNNDTLAAHNLRMGGTEDESSATLNNWGGGPAVGGALRALRARRQQNGVAGDSGGSEGSVAAVRPQPSSALSPRAPTPVTQSRLAEGRHAGSALSAARAYSGRMSPMDESAREGGFLGRRRFHTRAMSYEESPSVFHRGRLRDGGSHERALSHDAFVQHDPLAYMQSPSYEADSLYAIGLRDDNPMPSRLLSYGSPSPHGPHEEGLEGRLSLASTYEAGPSPERRTALDDESDEDFMRGSARDGSGHMRPVLDWDETGAVSPELRSIAAAREATRELRAVREAREAREARALVEAQEARARAEARRARAEARVARAEARAEREAIQTMQSELRRGTSSGGSEDELLPGPELFDPFDLRNPHGAEQTADLGDMGGSDWGASQGGDEWGPSQAYDGLNAFATRLHGLRLLVYMSAQLLRSDSMYGADELQMLAPVLARVPLPFGFILRDSTRPDPTPSVPTELIEERMGAQPFSKASQLPLHSSGECSICLSDFFEKSMVRVLPCKHLFHAACIDPWFARSTACPNCKQPVCEPCELPE